MSTSRREVLSNICGDQATARLWLPAVDTGLLAAVRAAEVSYYLKRLETSLTLIRALYET
jgi:hypothetical protein